jgi:hypothetical protein
VSSTTIEPTITGSCPDVRFTASRTRVLIRLLHVSCVMKRRASLEGPGVHVFILTLCGGATVRVELGPLACGPVDLFPVSYTHNSLTDPRGFSCFSCEFDEFY